VTATSIGTAAVQHWAIEAGAQKDLENCIATLNVSGNAFRAAVTNTNLRLTTYDTVIQSRSPAIKTMLMKEVISTIAKGAAIGRAFSKSAVTIGEGAAATGKGAATIGEGAAAIERVLLSLVRVLLLLERVRLPLVRVPLLLVRVLPPLVRALLLLERVALL